MVKNNIPQVYCIILAVNSGLYKKNPLLLQSFNLALDMKQGREFDIAHVGLKPGVHNFSYKIEDSFFEEYADIDFYNTSIQINLSVDKKTNLIILKFYLDGKVELLCDRCNDPMELRIFDEYQLFVKFVEGEIPEAQETEDADVVYYPRNENFLSIKEWIYEYIILSMPIQRVHENDENEESTCNPEVLALLALHELQIKETQKEEKTNNALTEQLNKIKIKKDAKS